MKKILAVGASLFLVIVAANSQTEKKEPPPPPKPKEEVKYNVVKEPKVVDEKVKLKEPPPPPPKPKEEIKYNVIEEKKEAIIIDEKVDVSKPGESPVITVKGKGADDFYKRNPTVSEISRKGNIIIIKKKDGTTEKYDMNKKEQDKSFTEKYGASPIPPPPPPPKKVS